MQHNRLRQTRAAGTGLKTMFHPSPNSSLVYLKYILFFFKYLPRIGEWKSEFLKNVCFLKNFAKGIERGEEDRGKRRGYLFELFHCYTTVQLQGQFLNLLYFHKKILTITAGFQI